MTTKRPRTKATVADEILEETDEFSRTELEYAEFLDEVGDSSATVYVYRISKSGQTAWCDTTTVDGVKDMEMLYDAYGPGKYKLCFRTPDRKWAGRKTVILADKKENPQPASNYGGGGNSGELKEAYEKQHALLLAVLAGQKGPDIGALMAGIGAMIGALKPATPTSDPANMLTAMITAFKELKGSAGGLDLAQLKDVLAIANDLKPGGEKEDNVYSVVKDVGNRIVDAVSGRGNGNAVAVPQGARLLEEAPAVRSVESQISSATQPQESQEQLMQKWLTAQIRLLKDKAKLNKDPGVWVDYVLDNPEEPGCRAVLMALERGAAFEHVLQFDPEIAQNPQLAAWFKTFYDELHAEILNDDTRGPGGNAGDAGNHAGGITPILGDATGPGAGGEPS